ncbi:MAG: hypothetical protein ACOYI2_01905 [Bacillota bacterium]|nr:hypothetical protein [Clostridia bacterium]
MDVNKILLIGIIGVIGSSLLYAIKAIRKLIRLKKWSYIGIFLAFAVGFPFIMKYVVQIKDEQIRLWVAVPTLLVALIWMFSGFFLSNIAEKTEHLPYSRSFMNPIIREKRSRKRIYGAALMLVGMIIWFYGAFFGADLPKSWEKTLMVASMFSLFYGFHRLTGGFKL